ncbi:PE family protein, partial [Mycobacterium asiaticum]|uniref:PE family protein n=1 Tax=Mycobacterium asiaticum TaxID=1790 RepID=UPI0009BCE1D6
MSFLSVAPEFAQAAATDLVGIESALRPTNAAIVTSTTNVAAAGVDEVSAAITALFNAHGAAYQTISAEALLFHEQFVALLSAGTHSYATAEAGNVSMQSVERQLLGALNAPTTTLLGRPLIGDGTAGSAANPNGGAGGLLWGNGGNGHNGAGGAGGAVSGNDGA